jgi:hypothetical protein
MSSCIIIIIGHIIVINKRNLNSRHHHHHHNHYHQHHYHQHHYRRQPRLFLFILFSFSTSVLSVHQHLKIIIVVVIIVVTIPCYRRPYCPSSQSASTLSIPSCQIKNISNGSTKSFPSLLLLPIGQMDILETCFASYIFFGNALKKRRYL